MRNEVGLAFSVCLISSWVTPIVTHADGVIETPPARNWFCGVDTKEDQIQSGSAKHPECGKAFAAIPRAGYNFMSVVTHTAGRETVKPLPKHVCSFDSETWKGVQTPWDVPMKWPTTPLKPGMQNLVWNGSWGAHFDDTRDFKFWITKAGFAFDSTRELTWDDFEEAPFCSEIYNDSTPTGNPDIVVDKTKLTFSIRCQVPSRSGHHILYGEWGRTESTLQRFHGCVDVAMEGSSGIPAGKPFPKRSPSRKVQPKRPELLGRKLDSKVTASRPSMP
jgi:chitin-binding protein